MTATELRIGNIVIDTYGKATKVYNIQGDGINSYRDMGANGIDRLIDLKPIKITDEWLDKLGFTCNMYRFDQTKYWSSDYFSYDSQKGFSYSGVKINNIDYVHQLQNVYFYLAGKELTVC